METTRGGLVTSAGIEDDEPELPLPIGDIDLEKKAEELGIKYFLVSYTPLNSDSRVSVIPKRAIRQVQQSGCGIPAAMFFNADGADPEMYLLPVPATLIQLPWRPEYGWVNSDLYMNDRPFNQCPRRALKRVVKRAREMGYVMKSGIEPEFIFLNKEGTELADPLDVEQPMSLQEPLATLRMAPVVMAIYDVMEKLGWEPYEVDHEASCCQYEINFGYDDCLVTADRHAFMKFMMKELAEKEGIRVTFMPVPLRNLLCANGLHINVSLWRTSDDSNAFKDSSDKDLGISATARHFIGGLMTHTVDSCAILCPTVNSYKRLNAGAWCPNTVSWGGNNRTVLFRVPADNRVEHRLADGSCNPYLAQAVILAAGLDGINRRLEPGDKVEGLITDHPKKFQSTPANLHEACQLLGQSSYLNQVLGQDLIKGFIAMKKREWDGYMGYLSDWERKFYLNC